MAATKRSASIEKPATNVRAPSRAEDPDTRVPGPASKAPRTAKPTSRPSAPSPSAPSRARAPRALPSPVELEPDVLAQSTVTRASGVAVVPSPRPGVYELVVDDFSPLVDAATARGIAADGHLATALVDRLRFVAGGRAWNGSFSYEATSRARCVVRGTDRGVLEDLAARYRALLATKDALLAAVRAANDDWQLNG